jgi:hypothetical protein
LADSALAFVDLARDLAGSVRSLFDFARVLLDAVRGLADPIADVVGRDARRAFAGGRLAGADARPPRRGTAGLFAGRIVDASTSCRAAAPFALDGDAKAAAAARRNPWGLE